MAPRPERAKGGLPSRPFERRRRPEVITVPSAIQGGLFLGTPPLDAPLHCRYCYVHQVNTDVKSTTFSDGGIE